MPRTPKLEALAAARARAANGPRDEQITLRVPTELRRFVDQEAERMQSATGLRVTPSDVVRVALQRLMKDRGG